ncbi:Putative flavin monooxygenase, FAD/NAD(P)-binding domain superfamily [Colletotrichum destructivum]|uniref:Flavin monooxygenase, FAD/NAD(P)-binding domain superfamily n=1 Tax=Colletotrichum destructivum TaxID=34406 RepID=A0AAX4IY04_9PEZI|nr:Putative flavin monooxygenase, FAD/NAD(P)-binding domain superfamily [Colletotrichum destructivum]
MADSSNAHKTKTPSGHRVRCIIIGAGVSGILMAYKLRTYLKDYVDFHIYEKSPDLGGTWFENRYPGCACDVSSHVYQFSFAPNPDWSQFFASSSEIQHYLKAVCRQFDLESYISYNSKVAEAQWQEDKGVWSVKVEGLDATEVHQSEILVNAGGILNNFKMPEIPGLSDFGGPIVHTAAWDDSVDLLGKRVAIIGAGASAVQLLPAIQPLCRSIDVYIRTPSWICPPVGLPPGSIENPSYTNAEKRRFREDAAYSLTMRKAMETEFNNMFAAFFKDSLEQNDMRAQYQHYMSSLIPDLGLRARLIPSFEAGCRRINPSAPYLAALQKSNVHPIFDRISRIRKDGIVLASSERHQEEGDTHTADVLISATGFDTSFRPRFPIIGRGGVDLRDLWKTEPASYMGIGVAGFPNYMTFLGPNTPISNGGLMGVLEATSDYFVRLLAEFCRKDVKSFDVTQTAQNDFSQHTSEYMKDMVWSGSCRSWFKSETTGRVSALWPGSSLQYIQVLAEDRFHDYAWSFKGNRFAHWNKGFSWIERPDLDPLGVAMAEARRSMNTLPYAGADLSFYLTEAKPLPVDTDVDDEKPAVTTFWG